MTECRACGAAASDGSIYCQKCGKKLEETRTSTETLFDFLKTQMTDVVEYQWDPKFEEVEIYKRFCEKVDITDLIYKEDGKLNINSEEAAVLAIRLLINEFNCIQTALNGLSQEFHNDRLAELNGAYEFYRRALLIGGDINSQKSELEKALDHCLIGKDKLKKEMQENLKMLEKYPKNVTRKIFCGMSPWKAENIYNQMREAFPYYCAAVVLQMCIDMQNKEIEKVNMTIADEQDFLQQIRNCDGYKRLQEVVVANEKKWDTYIDGLKAYMDFAPKCISKDPMKTKILEDKK